MTKTNIILRNPMRYLVPIGTAALTLIMFIPPIVFAGVSDAKMIAGATILVLCVVWLLRSALIAPFEMSLNDADLAIRRGIGTRHYTFAQIKKWWFAIPNGAPTNVAPGTNGMLYVVLDDKTHFRAEVTSEEASAISTHLASSSS